MIDKVVTIAREAGHVIKDAFGKQFTMEFKTNESNIVTEIDKRAEKVIIDYIKKEFPGHGIVAEESGEENKKAEYVWVIDPIDGTTNFAHGLPIFSVSIGVQKEGRTICGAVYDIMRDGMYHAELGGGAYCNSRKLKVNDNSNLRHSLLVTGFSYDVAENVEAPVAKFAAFLKTARAVRRLGSAAIDLCYVAEGIFDGFWELHLYPWDMCAGQLLVEEAGGKVTDFSGRRLSIYDGQLLATNGKVHDAMLEVINKA